MKKIKIVFFVLLFGLILNACGTVKEAFEAPRKNSSDEFLIEKKSPLSMPPKSQEVTKSIHLRYHHFTLHLGLR